MPAQTVFKRYEQKYLLTTDQQRVLLEIMAPYMAEDPYGHTTIRNLYFDTDDYRLIRRSMEKPAYKEKLRIRSYCRATPQQEVFVELKKKVNRVVYKRRIALPYGPAMAWLAGQAPCLANTQIAREIDYTLHFYPNLRPRVFLSYQRQAYFGRQDPTFRVTFDDTILCRLHALSLAQEAYGTPLLPPGQVLMELKCAGGMPLWMAHTLSGLGLYKTTFSKYATAYRTIIFPQLTHPHKEDVCHV